MHMCVEARSSVSDSLVLEMLAVVRPANAGAKISGSLQEQQKLSLTAGPFLWSHPTTTDFLR